MKNILIILLLIFTFTVYPASGVYDGFSADESLALSDWDTDTYKVGLLDSNHSFTAADDTWADISANEVSGTGYTAGGGTLDNCAVTEAATTKLDCDDEAWTTSTITAAHAVIYNTSNSDSLVTSSDFGGNESTVGGTFTIQFNASGIITKSD